MRHLLSWLGCLVGAVALGTSAALGAGGGAVAKGGPVVFVTVADLHVTDAQSMEEFKQAISQINDVIRPAFVYIAGDTPDGGTAEQYRLYKAVRDTIRCPVYDVAGDHEAKSGGMKNYRKVLGEPTYSFVQGAYRFVSLNSMGLDAAQLDWAKRELAAAKAQGQTPIAFVHHNLAGLKDKATAGQLDKVLSEGGVKLVLAGHTHNNIVINSGGRLDITTTSIRTPKGKDGKGYAVVTLDEGRIGWHFVPLGQQTIVATCSPIGKLMATGPEAVARGRTAVRVKAFDAEGIKSVTASLGGGAPVELKQDAAGTWTAEVDTTALKDGEQELVVTATNAAGRTASEKVVALVNQSGAFTPAPATVSDAMGGGKGPGKGGEKKGPKGGPKKEPVNMEQVPAAARSAIKHRAGENELTKLEKEVKDERETYKANWDVMGSKRELRVGADGSVIESRQEIAAGDLPEAVAAAAKKAVGDMKEAECKKIVQMKEGKAEERYEVRVDGDGGKKQLVIRADGSVEVKGPKGRKGPRVEKD